MDNILLEIMLALLGGGVIGGIGTYLINRGRQQESIEQQYTDIDCLKKKHDVDIQYLKVKHEMLEDKVQKVEKNNEIRLIKLETQITAMQIQQADIAKDVKLILKKHIYKEE